MIDPDRVLKMAYLPGEKVRVELGFQWDGNPSWTPSAATAQFRRFAGSRYSARRLGPHIFLLGREFRQGTEGEEAYTSVELEGVIPGSIAPGTYDCKYVHFQVPGRGWVLVFENLRLSITVVNEKCFERRSER
jgi:hypothetical protein